jgi:hypothetical protein
VTSHVVGKSSADNDRYGDTDNDAEWPLSELALCRMLAIFEEQDSSADRNDGTDTDEDVATRSVGLTSRIGDGV